MQDILDQEDDPDFDYKRLTENDWLTFFIKDSDQFIGRFKVA